MNISLLVYQEEYTPLAYIRWTTRKGDRSPRDRLSQARIRGRKKISAMPPSGAALYPSSGSVHVRRNSDPAGIASGISKTDCVGGRALDLWCNANLSEFYSPPLSATDPSFSLSRLFVARARSRREGVDGAGSGQRKGRSRDGGGSRFLKKKKIAISRKL